MSARSRRTERSWIGAALAVVVLGVGRTASANPEPAGVPDARAIGMAGQAVAIVASDTALFHNPAGLALIERFSATISLAPQVSLFRAPYAGTGSETNSRPTVAPFGYAGVALRIGNWLALGVGAYTHTGFGSRFVGLTRVDDCVPREIPGGMGAPVTEGCVTLPGETATTVQARVTLVVGELAVPVAFRLSERFRIGASLRIGYARQDVRAYQELSAGNWTDVRLRQSGYAFPGRGVPGLLAGFQWDLSRRVTLGFAYRSKMRIDMDGPASATVGGFEFVVDPRSSWRVPHMLRAGLAGRLRGERLLLSAELRAQFHGDANVEQVFRSPRLGMFGGDIVVPLRWRNAYAGSLGLSYLVSQSFAFRAGMSVGNSATPRSTVTPFVTPPGLLWTFATGAGYLSDHFDFNLGFAFTSVEDVELRSRNASFCYNDATVKSGCDGRYSWSSYVVATSLSFHL